MLQKRQRDTTFPLPQTVDKVPAKAHDKRMSK